MLATDAPESNFAIVTLKLGLNKKTRVVWNRAQYLTKRLSTGGPRYSQTINLRICLFTLSINCQNDYFLANNRLFICEFKIRGPKWRHANNEGNLYLFNRLLTCCIVLPYNSNFIILYMYTGIPKLQRKAIRKFNDGPKIEWQLLLRIWISSTLLTVWFKLKPILATVLMISLKKVIQFKNDLNMITFLLFIKVPSHPWKTVVYDSLGKLKKNCKNSYLYNSNTFSSTGLSNKSSPCTK